MVGHINWLQEITQLLKNATKSPTQRTNVHHHHTHTHTTVMN